MTTTIRKPIARIFAISVAVMCVSCAGAPVPQAQRTEAQSAIRGAQEGGAFAEPQAALHLKMAKDEVRNAERLIAIGENLLAKQALERAASDAELALQLARTAVEADEAEAALSRVHALNLETSR